MAVGYFSLGPDAEAMAERTLRRYYGSSPYVDRVVGGTLTTDLAVRDTLSAFESLGCDELILFPCNPDPDQVDRLAAAVRA
jgi:hypothetical protein